MRRRVTIPVLLSLAVTACGSDALPSRAKFIEELAGGYATELRSVATKNDLDPDELRTAYEELLGCFYDELDDEDLISLIDDETTATFDRVAAGDGKACEQTFREQIDLLVTEARRDG